MPTFQFISCSKIEHGSNRPYAALMYMGFSYLEYSVYKDAYYQGRYGKRHPIHKIAVSNSHILIIYNDNIVISVQLKLLNTRENPRTPDLRLMSVSQNA